MQIRLGALVLLLAGIAALGALPVHARSLAAINLSNSPDDSRNPTLAIAPNGTRQVVWEESEQTGITYLWSRVFDGVAWSPVVTVSTGTRPVLAIGPDNTAHLVWTDEFSGTLQVFYSQSAGAGWSVPKLAAPGLSGNAGAPSIAVGTDNVVRVVWGQFQDTGFKVYYAQAGSGGAGAWVYGPVPNATGTAPSVVLDAGGHAYVAWQQSVGGARDILYSAFDGATWSTPENVSQSPSDSIAPALCLMGNGRPLVVWSELFGSQFDVLSSSRPAAWTVPVNVSSSSADSLRPRLFCAPRGLFVAWNEVTTPAGVNLSFGNLGAWTKPLPLATAAGDWSDAALAGAGDGSLHVAYDGGPAPAGEIMVDRLSLFNTWLPLTLR